MLISFLLPSPKGNSGQNEPQQKKLGTRKYFQVQIRWAEVFLIFIFNWRIIALQFCVAFCHTSTWISHRYTHVASLLNLPPTFQGCHRGLGWAPMSYSKFPLAIYFIYGKVYVSMLLSQFVPPFLSPAVSTNLFSMSVSLFLPCK